MHQIGVGVLGPVFRTYEPTEDRLVAVKAFHLDITPEQAKTLVDALTRIVESGLSHPGLVEPIDVGFEDGVPYMAQEYVAAESLDVAMRHYAPAPVETAMPFIRQIGAAIDAAHEQGFVHGALHLRDIFVTPDEVKLTGFGVVKALEELRLAGPIRRPYTAPEVIAGRTWGSEADLFALAAVAYELLTGRRAAGTGEQVTERLNAVEHVADGEALQAVFATALSDNPDDRYSSAARFVSSLESAIGQEGSGAAKILSSEGAAATAGAPTDLLAGLDLYHDDVLPSRADLENRPVDVREAADELADSPRSTDQLEPESDDAGPVEPDEDIELDESSGLDAQSPDEVYDEADEMLHGDADDERDQRVEVVEEEALSGHEGEDRDEDDWDDADTDAEDESGELDRPLVELDAGAEAADHDPGDLVDEVPASEVVSVEFSEASTETESEGLADAADQAHEAGQADEDVAAVVGREDDVLDVGIASASEFEFESESEEVASVSHEEDDDDDKEPESVSAPDVLFGIDRRGESAESESEFAEQDADETQAEADDIASAPIFAEEVDTERELATERELEDDEAYLLEPNDEQAEQEDLDGVPPYLPPIDLTRRRSWVSRGAVPLIGIVLAVGAAAYFLAVGFRQTEPTDQVLDTRNAADGASLEFSEELVESPEPSSEPDPVDVSAVPPVRPGSSPALPPSVVSEPAPAPAPAPSSPPRAAAAPAPSAPPAPAPASERTSGWILVRTDPPGARVTIDGVLRGETPLSQEDISYGDHDIEIALPGFSTVSQIVTVSPTEAVAKIGVTLTPGRDLASPSPAAQQGALVFESRPSGARVVVDGELVGTTPTRLEVSAGRHTVRLEIDGYQAWSTTVAVTDAEPKHVSASLDRVAR